MRLFFGYFCCRSLYGFVDWNIISYSTCLFISVEAYTASWIEIRTNIKLSIVRLSKPIRLRGLKSIKGNNDKSLVPSKPIRLRGLKFTDGHHRKGAAESKPIRLRGLKFPWFVWYDPFLPSKPIRLRGLKSILAIVVLLLYVEAYTASWIEMVVGRPQQMHILSKPIRLRGLK